MIAIVLLLIFIRFLIGLLTKKTDSVKDDLDKFIEETDERNSILDKLKDKINKKTDK